MITGNFMNVEATIGWHTLLAALQKFLAGTPDMERITEDDAVKLETMAANIRERIADRTPKDEERCAVCGWVLADVATNGCVRGNCSLRPLPEVWYDVQRAIREYGERGIILVPRGSGATGAMSAQLCGLGREKNFMGCAGDQSKESR